MDEKFKGRANVPKLHSLVPMIHVKNVERSIEFYKSMGFDNAHAHTNEGDSESSWAWMSSGGAHLMLVRAGEPIDPEVQAIIFYVYCEDVAKCRNELLSNGVQCGEITYPFYCPRGEFRVRDLDGWCIMVTHTGE